MKFTLSWLRDHLDTDASADAIAERLTAIGLEVEGVSNPAHALAAFRIARVLSAAPHPQADKLQVLSVDIGDGAPLQVVCGAPNARAGLVGVFGAAGAVVPSNNMVLKVTSIRGVESNGMMCSSRELELGDDHDGIIDLPADAPVGARYADWAGLDDPLFDVAITPNRQDCMGVRGIARDLAAAGLGTLKPLIVPDIVGEGPCAITIRTNDPAGCPIFLGRSIAGVRNGSAPDWMARRLKAIGQRPISALVDITNYVMFDLGRPSHAYDLATLDGFLVARPAHPDEAVAALNGKTYALSPSMTVIADANGAHDIGGIMGGERSGVGAATTDIVLEVAYFAPESIALTGQALGLASDARARFERGVDPAFLDDATAILTGLIVEHCGGTPSTVTRSGDLAVDARRIAFDPVLTARLGGIDVPVERQHAILAALGFTQSGDTVAVPSWRRDIDGAEDLVEEIVRIVGLGAVVSTPLPRADGVAKPTATPAQKVERAVRRAAAARGLHEAITWSFIGDDEAAAFGGAAWTLANPIAETMRAMRPSLLPGLLAAARRNLARGVESVRLFEVGRRYLADGERPTLGIVLAGERAPRGWASGKAQGFDAYDVKSDIVALLEACGVPIDNLQVMGEAGSWFHPGQSGTLRLGPKTVLASFGTLHPGIARAFDIAVPVMVAELYLDAVPVRRSSGTARRAFAPPALQSVRRDFAFLVPDTLAADALVRAIRGADKAAITGARVFDRFVGTGVPEGQVSLAVEVMLQPTAQSFTEVELATIATKIVAAAGKLGAYLRG